MKRSLVVSAAVLAQLAVTAFTATAQDKTLLRLVQTITVPNVKGRIDHLDVDVKGMRLFARA